MFIKFAPNARNGKRVVVKCDMCGVIRTIDYKNYLESEEKSDLHNRKERNLCKQCHPKRLSMERTEKQIKRRRKKLPPKEITNHRALTLRV